MGNLNNLQTAFLTSITFYAGGVDSDDNLNLVAEPGQDLSFPGVASAAGGGAPGGAPSVEAFGAAAPLPYILPS